MKETEGRRSVKRIFCALLFSGPKEEGWKAADDVDEQGGRTEQARMHFYGAECVPDLSYCFHIQNRAQKCLEEDQ